MRRAVWISALVILFTCLYFVVAHYVVLKSAKEDAVKKYADGGWGERMLNTVPQPPSRIIKPAVDYTNTVWMKVAESRSQIGFPADSFARDPHPKRENAVIHHSDYRAIIGSAGTPKMFKQLMEPLGFTNLYEFVSTAFHTTAGDIHKQASLAALKRHVILLEAKGVLAPRSFDDSCIEFGRQDLRGFIAGDPSRSKYLNIQIYVESSQELIDVAVILKRPVQMSEIEESISVLKIQTTAPASSPK